MLKESCLYLCLISFHYYTVSQGNDHFENHSCEKGQITQQFEDIKKYFRKKLNETANFFYCRIKLTVGIMSEKSKRILEWLNNYNVNSL